MVGEASGVLFTGSLLLRTSASTLKRLKLFP
jgi:hypothetical protein